jgi:methionine synthase I (cobalamin-dependent)
LNETDVFAIGVNCGKSLETNLQVLQTLKELTDKFLWFKPNAGAPQTDETGQVHYHISPAAMGEQAKEWVTSGARFVGGCCGTSPEHLAAIKEGVKA